MKKYRSYPSKDFVKRKTIKKKYRSYPSKDFVKRNKIKDCFNCGWQKPNSDLSKDPVCTSPNIGCITQGMFYWATRKKVLKILEQQRLEQKSW